MLGPVVSVSKQTPMHRAEQAMTSFFLLRRLRLVGTGVPSHRPRVLHFLAGMLLAAVAEFATHGCGVQSGSPPDLIVLKVTDLGTLPTNPDILGRDGGYSAVFQGDSTWLYGDTFLAKPNAEDFTLISDSWSDTTDLNARDGITGFQERLDSTGAPTMILPETSAEQTFNAAHNSNNCQEQPCGARWALWPASILVDPTSGHALIFYMLVYALPAASISKP
jgi:hypothetical protein